jgi:hypothetical protein
MSLCGSTCTSRAAPVASRAVTERSRPPVIRRRTCRTPEGPKGTSRSSSPKPRKQAELKGRVC